MGTWEVWAEMARRKVRFHNDENWEDIKLWGLFYRSYIKSLVEKGLLIPHNKCYNPRCLDWYQPSANAWFNHIKPLVENETLEGLTSLAGWKV